jgi:hypothetical protein
MKDKKDIQEKIEKLRKEFPDQQSISNAVPLV